MANVIFRGPIERQPRTVTDKKVAGAYLPGCVVEQTATELVQLTTAEGKLPLVLSNLEFVDQGVTDAYTTGTTGEAYEPHPQDVYQCRMAADTFAHQDPLTVGASGRLQKAVAGDVVVAFFSDTPGTLTADDFADVVWANAYTVPAA